MFTRIRKHNTILGVLGLFLTISIVIMGLNGILNVWDVSGTLSELKPTIIIDPGHGGVDPGAIGVNKANEKDINLGISLTLRDMLVVNGYNVIMTRDMDTAINDKRYKSIVQIKTSDLKNRLRIFDENQESIVVSIHQNKFEQESSKGAQMFYGRKNEQSKALALSIQNAFVENLQPENKRQIKRSTSDVYIIHNAKNPIVLVECGFISNSSDAKNLVDTEYQTKIAFTIFSGIVNYSNAEVISDDNLK